MKTKTKKEELVASRVPRELLSDMKKIESVEHLDRSTNVRRLLYAGIHEWKLGNAARLYRDGRVTLAAAAREADTTVREMMDYLRENKIPYQYGAEELDEDMKALRERVPKRARRAR